RGVRAARAPARAHPRHRLAARRLAARGAARQAALPARVARPAAPGGARHVPDAMSTNRPRVGVIGLATSGRSPGLTYTPTLLQAVVAAGGAERFELVLVASQGGVDVGRGLPLRVHPCEPGDRDRTEAWVAERAPRAGRAGRLAARAVARVLGRIPEPALLLE